MTIKGTLETFNLRELLQMLAFNQKVGTLALETDRGRRTIYVDRGTATFVSGDSVFGRALLRAIRRRGIVREDMLPEAVKRQEVSGRFLGDVLEEMGLFEAATRQVACEEAVGECFLDLQLSAITHFEFLDGESVAPDGRAGDPIQPPMVVESLLLDLTRKMDQWTVLLETVPGMEEVFEGTGLAVDLEAALAEEEVDPALADRLLPHVDGYSSLEEVVESSDVDRLTVLQITSALFQGGGLRPVPTEDLITRAQELVGRGDSARALPMLRRSLERGDAPSETRLVLADALEATGRPLEAAEELSVFVGENEDAPPLTVFDVMHRTMALRDGDAATAAQICDYYLANRPWLRKRREQASDTLRELIHVAVASREPLLAAERLEQFIECGDAPSEDLLVLSDLYGSAGRNQLAARALCRRAEDLFASGRMGPGRDLFRRALQLDPSRGDVRARLHVMDGHEQRRRQKRRLVSFLIVLALLMVGAGMAWWVYNQRAGAAVRKAREAAEHALKKAEDKARALIDAFRARVERAAEALEYDEELALAAQDLVARVRQALHESEGALYEFTTELERHHATDLKETNLAILRHLETRREVVVDQAEAAVVAAQKEGHAALRAGERAHAEGEFVAAERELRKARNLSMRDEATRARAELLLGHVQEYIRNFEVGRARLDAARQRGNLGTAYAAGLELLVQQLDSDLTRSLLLPVRVVSEPEGAEVWLGSRFTGHRTPCVVDYSPFGTTTLVLLLPGRVTKTFALPSFESIRADPEAAALWEPHITVEMPAGPCWRIPASQGPFAAIWEAGGVPNLLLADGTGVHAVDPVKHRLEELRTFRRPHPVRLAGSLPGDVEWRILGHRTLLVKAPETPPWEAQVLGRLARRPAIAGTEGVLLVLDEAGTAYGLDVLSGRERWRRDLGSAPTQEPYASPLGFLVGTEEGGVMALDVVGGQVRLLAPAVQGNAVVLPLGTGAVILGGGTDGVRIVEHNGGLRPVGNARPLADLPPWISPEGVAWLDEDGVRWLGREANAPVLVRGLGPRPVALTGQGAVLYAVGAEGTLRAARASEPEKPMWETPLGARRVDGMLVLGSLVYVLADGGLATVQR